MIIITGATSSIAHALARQLASDGHDLILCAKDKDKLNPIIADIKAKYNTKVTGFLFDAIEIEKHESLIKKIYERYPKVEGVILAHGYVNRGDVLNTKTEEIHKLIHINYESIISLSQAYINIYKKGFLCVITSIAGERGKTRNLIYNSAKGAVSLYLEGLEQASNISIIEVRPGWIDTQMSYGYIESSLIASREKAARDIIKAIRKRKRLIYTPWFWRYIMFILRNTPRIIWNKLKL